MNSVETAKQLIEAERDNLLELVGTRLVSTWVVWNLEYGGWVNWRPVVLVFENRTLSLDWFFHFAGELHYQWTPFDPASPAFEVNSSRNPRMEWRKDRLPELRSVLGQEVKRVWVGEYVEVLHHPCRILGFHHRNRNFHFDSISFELEHGWLSVINSGDENALLARGPNDKLSRRTDVVSGDIFDSTGI